MKTRSEAKKDKETAAPAPDESTPSLEDIVEREKSPFQFESVNATKGPKIRPDFAKITETVFVTDLHETWQRLKKRLTIGEKRSDHGTLQEALDGAEKNAYDAHRLFITAKVEFDQWEKDNQIVLAAMRSEATHALQKEKEDGIRAKQITDADIVAKCAAQFPDQWKAQEIARAKYKATVDSLGNFSEQWSSRCRTLQGMLAKLRG